MWRKRRRSGLLAVLKRRAKRAEYSLSAHQRRRGSSSRTGPVWRTAAVRVTGSGLGGPDAWLAMLPEPLGRVVAWTRDLPSGTPLLIPPIFVEIH